MKCLVRAFLVFRLPGLPGFTWPVVISRAQRPANDIVVLGAD